MAFEVVCEVERDRTAGVAAACEQVLAIRDGGTLVFAFSAVDERGTVVGTGTVERIVVDRERSLARTAR